MAKLIRRRWQRTLDAGLPRRARQPCEYEAYAPDPLLGRSIKLDGDVAADVADAEKRTNSLNLSVTTLVNTEILARLLLRAESVASSRIEGLEVGGRRLLRAEAARTLNDPQSDVTAAEVLANVDAMVWAIDSISPAEDISLAHILEMHRRLLGPTQLAQHAGRLRTTQNWIGGTSYNPCGASFVPPPHELVPALLDDLWQFCNDDALPAVAQAAIAHAQFETIHPFVDGNGRIGRALIQLILRRRGLATRVFPPVSLILATRADDYIAGLAATRYVGPPSSDAAHAGLNQWVGTFAASVQRAADDALDFEQRVMAMQQTWRSQVGRVRHKSAADALLQALPGVPLVTVNSAAALIERSFEATNNAIAQLVEAKVLAPVRIGRRNRAFEATDAINLFNDFERQLASPTGNTISAPPARPVPYRRK